MTGHQSIRPQHGVHHNHKSSRRQPASCIQSEFVRILSVWSLTKQQSLIAMSIFWWAESGKIIDAESVIGIAVWYVLMSVGVCMGVCVCINWWLKGLQCHLGPEDISSSTSEMGEEMINKPRFIGYAWAAAAPGPHRLSVFVPHSHLWSKCSHKMQLESFLKLLKSPKIWKRNGWWILPVTRIWLQHS